MNMPGTVEKVKEIDEEIEALYQKIELEIDGIVKEGQKLNSLAYHETLYRKLYIRSPPAAGSKLSKLYRYNNCRFFEDQYCKH